MHCYQTQLEKWLVNLLLWMWDRIGQGAKLKSGGGWHSLSTPSSHTTDCRPHKHTHTNAHTFILSPLLPQRLAWQHKHAHKQFSQQIILFTHSRIIAHSRTHTHTRTHHERGVGKLCRYTLLFLGNAAQSAPFPLVWTTCRQQHDFSRKKKLNDYEMCLSTSWGKKKKKNARIFWASWS